MNNKDLRDVLQHMLVVLQNIEYLPLKPSEEDIMELKQVGDVKRDVELALNDLNETERESN